MRILEANSATRHLLRYNGYMIKYAKTILNSLLKQDKAAVYE